MVLIVNINFKYKFKALIGLSSLNPNYGSTLLKFVCLLFKLNFKHLEFTPSYLKIYIVHLIALTSEEYSEVG